ncbi:hypothetical protein NC796_12495 [Aliifodinibius sp. S!AR15-10]|uniref:hypothetical protein n=1 Tax=Aliifodinibius sp. S!AR15-10 TaxID=2950437 RepID=UPI002860035E|nr:hypothetical protein [Aliifodinibius sp. S!AR15-10]MDR8391969.1 hypothetical protein [Aliifodinibius sp. S!AR15-10]
MALFPTFETPDDTGITGYIHLAFAALFLTTLVYFSLFLFTKTDPDKQPTEEKIKRNMVYKFCGYTMLCCIVLIPIYFLLPESATSYIKPYQPVFWFEAVAVTAFGISWLTKGEAILADKNHGYK